MTGAYVRVKRGGVWDNVEIDQLTDAELDTLLVDLTQGRCMMWAKFLAGWIRDNVRDEPREAERS
jgi:hypothetical protein